MSPENETKSRPQDSRAPRSGLQLMAVILVAMTLLAIYSNIQKAHLDQIEKVTIIAEPSPPSSPTPALR